MRTSAFAAILTSTLALSAISFGDGLNIKRAPKEGVLAKYTSTMEIDVNSSHVTMVATVSEKVLSVDKDGNFTVEQSQIDASGTYNKEKFDVPARAPITMTYKPSGQVSLIKGDLTDAFSYRMENLGTIIDPGKAVNVNDTWLADFKADKILGTVEAHAQYKVLGEEKLGQVDTIKVKGSIKEISGEKPASNEFTEWISKEDGSMVKLEATWTNAPFPGVSYPVSAVIKMERVAS